MASDLAGERAARIDDTLEALRGGLSRLARAEAAVDVLRVAECRAVLGALGDAGVPALVFKGGALAHSHYAESYLRPRDDTDLLVEESRLAQLDRVMTGMGYATQAASSGRFMSHQRLYVAVDARGVRHNFDVHWRISNRQRYAGLLGYDELRERSRPLPGHAPPARCPCPEDALLIAALHRAGHRGTNRLIWLYDIHLLLSVMNEQDIARARARAAQKGLAQELEAGVAGAGRCFGGDSASPVDALTEAAGSRSRGVRTIDIWLADLRALPTWRARLALLKEHSFPSAEYMLGRNGAGNRLTLPFAYLARGLRGSLKLFRRA